MKRFPASRRLPGMFLSGAFLPGALLFAGALLSPQPARSAAPLAIPFTADRWRPVDTQVNHPLQAPLRFLQQEAFPGGLLRLDSGSALLSGLSFDTGTIEFDIKPLPGDGLPGIRFRQRDRDTAEDFYIRPSADCPASQDCLQYTPVTHGRMLWDLFVQDQAPAPIRPTDWNHVRLVVSRHRMEAFINQAAVPSLVVGALQGDAASGGIELEGPAVFANLLVAPHATAGLPAGPAPDPAAADRHLLRHWLVSTPATMSAGTDPIPPAAMPGGPGGSWTAIEAERGGLVDISRFAPPPRELPAPATVWLATSLVSARAQTRHVSIGWLREAWVFDNGRQVFAGRNLYNSATERKAPDGRLSLRNGGFDLKLRAGRNDVLVALGNNSPPAGSGLYGWGLEMRLDDGRGVRGLDGPPP